MPYLLTIWISRLAGQMSRLVGRGEGATVPGYLAEDLRPELLGELGRQIQADTILITGTNGKTTTTKMVREILEASGRLVISNQDGSNLRRGVLSTLMRATNWRGQLPAAASAVLEVDEAALPEVARALRPSWIVVLNLFRDQLDRYGELDTTAELIGGAIKQSRANVLLNADDPLVAGLARFVDPKRQATFFGIEAQYQSKLRHDHTADSTHDPATGEPLRYERVFFGHLGHYSGPGQRKRPRPDMAITDIRQLTASGSQTTIAFGKQSARLSLGLPGLYNLYNALAALAVSSSLGINDQLAVGLLSETAPAFGRVEILESEGRKIQLLLIKNPTGFNQVIETFLLNGSGPVVFLINDNFADGRDVSWLWDAAVEDLPSKQTYWVGGLRAADMAVRLKYAGKSVQLGDESDNIESLLRAVMSSTRPGELIRVVPTYTAMLEVRRLLGAGKSQVKA